MARQVCMNSCRPYWLASCWSQKAVRAGRLCARADAVAPVVGVGEAAAGPAQQRGLDGAHGVDEVLADAVDVGDLRVLANPDAVVDDSAEMLDEVTVDLRRDGADGLGGEDLDVRVDLRGLREQRRRTESERGGGECAGLEKGAAGGRHLEMFPRSKR